MENQLTNREKIELTENQIKVIKDKYLKNSDNVEEWLDLVAGNIALADLIHDDEVPKEEIYEGINNNIENIETNNGNHTKLILLHKNLELANDRDTNFKKYINNLKKASQKETVKQRYEFTKNKFYNLKYKLAD